MDFKTHIVIIGDYENPNLLGHDTFNNYVKTVGSVNIDVWEIRSSELDMEDPIFKGASAAVVLGSEDKDKFAKAIWRVEPEIPISIASKINEAAFKHILLRIANRVTV
jgi:hypothetical protein